MSTQKAIIFVVSLAVGIIAIIQSCSFPYQPEQFIMPEPKAGFVDKGTISAFLGTTNTKLVYTLELNGIPTVYYVDFNDSLPTARKLKKPADKADWNADSPLLSPDGSYVAYFVTASGQYAAYIQKLDTASTPVLITQPATDPHWWKDSAGNLFIVYSDRGGIIMERLEDLTGYATYRQKVDIINGQIVGTPEKIADVPYNGGLSGNGRYLCTGYQYAYFYSLMDSLLFPINVGKQTCNPSIAPDTFGNQMMFLNIQGVQALNNDPYSGASLLQHQTIFIVDRGNSVIHYYDHPTMFSNRKNSWQDPEWSNHINFFTALAQDASGKWDCYVIKISTSDTLMLNDPTMLRLNETSTPSLWIHQ